jgi:hypothetical protein
MVSGELIVFIIEKEQQRGITIGTGNGNGNGKKKNGIVCGRGEK